METIKKCLNFITGTYELMHKMFQFRISLHVIIEI